MDYYGYTAEGALSCATRNGGLAMRDEGDLGTISVDALADLLLVRGNPLQDVSIMTDASRIVMIMKDGKIYKNTAGAIAHRAAA